MPRAALTLPGLGRARDVAARPSWSRGTAPRRRRRAHVAAGDLAPVRRGFGTRSRAPQPLRGRDGLSCADVHPAYAPRPDGRIGVVNRCRNAAAGGAERGGGGPGLCGWRGAAARGSG
jgi:hypothetical protein